MAAIIPIPAFADNYIWLLREGAAAAVVDPGDAAPVIAYLEREGIALSAILATHHHGDHVGGVRDLVARWPVPVFGPAHETIPGRTHALAQGRSITVPGVGCRFSVLDIPGHTSGHIAYVGDDILFCGDTLFAAGCGRLFEGTPAQMVASLDKLAALPDKVSVYCGHEYTLSNLKFALVVEQESQALRAREARERSKRERGLPTLPSTIAEERLTNPFLRTREPAVCAAAQRHAGRPLANRVAVFAELRAWKNAL
ncbi:MAG TPA: hydroxyacylglutathione hydrolase [Casimicrobiaceae bacterium]|nr:hydroxyacylglutathione hydrolase [Casimicrobiaceae bacterium]